MSVRQIPAPVQGQLVMVRQRPYVVVDVIQGLPTAQREQSEALYPALPVEAHGAPQHKVLLSSVEDDALGQELQVIWEIEPGTSIIERNNFPEPRGFDTPQRLDTFLNAVRWGAVSNAEVMALQAPFRSGIDLETYQLDPVARAIQMPRVNLLIADDVGLGKTIEAGLVCQELIIRHRARTVLIICPAPLQVQWQEQMREKFGLEFAIVDNELLRQLRRTRGIHTNPWSHFPRLITSIDFIKRERPLRLFKMLLPGPKESPYPRRFDLLILDEAHNVAPAGKQQYITDSQRTKTLRELAPHFEHKLFLSATPHNGYEESFQALLELLDNQRFARGVPINRSQLERVMIRRLKAEMKKWDDAPRFPERKLHPLFVDYTAEERAMHEKLAEYTRLRMDGARRNEQEHVANTFVLTLLKKRLFSSPRAFLRTLERHRSSLKKERQAGYMPNSRALRGWIEDLEEGIGELEEVDESEGEPGLDEMTSAAIEEAALLSQPLSTREEQLLDEMCAWAEKADRRANDSKVRVLLDWLREHIKPGGEWSERRVIIFTEYRATQSWLQDLLASSGFSGGERLALLYGGMPGDIRERIKATFQADPTLSPLRILLATDAASEGLDLQNHCSHLIHYEIPWNPNRLEQRNGRIDRHGQRASQVDIYHFVGSQLLAREEQGQPVTIENVGTLDGDLEFLWIALKKVEAIREDLGKVGPVIADQVVEAMLGGKRHQLRTEQAEREAERARRRYKFEEDIQKRVIYLREKLLESRRVLEMTPENIQFVVETALELANQPPLRRVLVSDARGEQTIEAFEVPALGGSWSSVTTGLRHPLTGKQRPLVFDPTLARGRDDVVLAHLNHRLVAMAQALLRAATWRPDAHLQHLYRVTARTVPDLHLDTPAVVAYARLVILGGDSQRLHEELIVAGGLLREGRFETLKDRDLQRILEHSTTRQVTPAWEERLRAIWPTQRERLYRALETLQQSRVKRLESYLEKRMASETSLIEGVLTELRQNIEQTLHQDEVVQLTFEDLDARRQFETDRQQLRVRAEAITGEIANERETIQARYANRQARLFPVAVAFLVPEGQLRNL